MVKSNFKSLKTEAVKQNFPYAYDI